MVESLRLAAILFLICALSAGILAEVYLITNLQIQKNVELEEIGKRNQVLPEAINFQLQERNGMKFYRGIDTNGKEVGVAFPFLSRGYGGPIRMMVGINPEGKITGVAISPLDHTETPGLGAKITGESFLSQLKGRTFSEIKLRSEDGSIDAIAGATVSSRAVCEGVKKALELWGEAEGRDKI